jgi:hypothetical protein
LSRWASLSSATIDLLWQGRCKNAPEHPIAS